MDENSVGEVNDAIQQLTHDLEQFCHDYEPSVSSVALLWFTVQFMAHFKKGDVTTAARAASAVILEMAEGGDG